MSEAKKLHFHGIFGDQGILKKKGVSPATFNSRLGLFIAIFNAGMKEEVPVCLNNPLRFFQKAKPKSRTWKALDGLSEASELLEVARTHRDGNTFPLIFLCLNTGARVSSVLGFRWRDVDFDKQTISLREMYSREEKTLLKLGLKSRPGEMRVHAMSRQLVGFLRSWRAESKWSAPEDFVVPGTKRGEPLRYPAAWMRLSSLNKELERRTGRKWGARYHQFRHTFAVQYLASGGRIEELKEFLDHRDIATTQIYGRLNSEQMHTQANIVSFEPRRSDDKLLTLVSSS
jgi:integrase